MTTKTEDEQIQAALDAALDDLDSDEEPDDEPKSAPVMMGPPRPPPTAAGSSSNNDEQLEQIDQMMQQLLMGGGGGDLGNEGHSANVLEGIMGNLESHMMQQDPDLDNTTLEEMMQRLAERQTQRDSTDDMPSGNEDDLLKNLMGAMGGGDGAALDSDEMINGMMKELLSKELMYEPMQQVVERFPAWLKENESKLDPPEFKRRQEQYDYFRRIVHMYEQPSYDAMGSILELMQEVQEYGQPPMEIIQDIAPGTELDEDGEPKFPFPMGEDGEECCIS